MKNLTATEQKLLEFLFEETVYAKTFVVSEDYKASIERNGTREWDQGRLRAILDVSPVNGPLLAGEAYPIYLSAEIREDEFTGGITIHWDMPENEWGHAQSNAWPYKPYLKKPQEVKG